VAGEVEVENGATGEVVVDRTPQVRGTIIVDGNGVQDVTGELVVRVVPPSSGPASGGSRMISSGRTPS
jgi:hypothetical protein